jgi:uncharacterized protein
MNRVHPTARDWCHIPGVEPVRRADRRFRRRIRGWTPALGADGNRKEYSDSIPKVIRGSVFAPLGQGLAKGGQRERWNGLVRRSFGPEIGVEWDAHPWRQSEDAGANAFVVHFQAIEPTEAGLDRREGRLVHARCDEERRDRPGRGVCLNPDAQDRIGVDLTSGRASDEDASRLHGRSAELGDEERHGLLGATEHRGDEGVIPLHAEGLKGESSGVFAHHRRRDALGDPLDLGLAATASDHRAPHGTRYVARPAVAQQPRRLSCDLVAFLLRPIRRSPSHPHKCTSRSRVRKPPYTAVMRSPLNHDESRVLGTLIEKAQTTPNQYPLTLNALVNGVNQKSNRTPVVTIDDLRALRALDGLRSKGFVREVSMAGSRVEKFRHVAREALNAGTNEICLLAELLLRGPQTVGELRTHASRMCPFETLEAVEAVLAEMAKGATPTVRELPPAPGSRAPRWVQLLCPDLHPLDAVAPAGLGEGDGEGDGERAAGRMAALEERVVALETTVATLADELAALKRALS